MNTLELRPYKNILWHNRTPQQVRDREYAGAQLTPMHGQTPVSLDPQAVFCRAWMVDGVGTMLVEIPGEIYKHAR